MHPTLEKKYSESSKKALPIIGDPRAKMSRTKNGIVQCVLRRMRAPAKGSGRKYNLLMMSCGCGSVSPGELKKRTWLTDLSFSWFPPENGPPFLPSDCSSRDGGKGRNGLQPGRYIGTCTMRPVKFEIIFFLKKRRPPLSINVGPGNRKRLSYREF